MGVAADSRERGLPCLVAGILRLAVGALRAGADVRLQRGPRVVGHQKGVIRNGVDLLRIRLSITRWPSDAGV